MQTTLMHRASTMAWISHRSGTDLWRCRSKWHRRKRHPLRAAKSRARRKIPIGDRSKIEMIL